MKYLTVLFFLVVFLSSCSDFSPSETTAQLKQKKYFDLAGYFETQIERLGQRDDFEKSTSVNGIVETQSNAQVDLEKELAIFSSADINRPAWSDKYEVDSTFNEQKELVNLRYQTSDEKLRTRQIFIEFEKGEVSKIEIENLTSSTIANTEQTLTYEPNQGYAIESRQKVQTIDEAVLRIEVKF